MIVPILPFLLVALGFSGPALAEVEAFTADGRKVLLKDDHTWQYLSSDDVPPEHLTIEITKRESIPKGCLFWLRATNHSSVRVKNIVPQFLAFMDRNVMYERVFRSFEGLKPTQSQSRKITFSGIACEEIAYLKVAGADRCSWGELHKYAAEKGECLRRVELLPGELTPLVK